MAFADLDPMQERTRRLAQALTTSRSQARSTDGYLVVEACADGELTIHIDDRAFVYGGRAVGGELTRLAAAALGKARAEVREAAAELRADPRLTAMVEETEDAMNRPLPVADRPTEHPAIPPRSDHRAPASSARRQQPPTDLYDDYDPYYHRKSWLVD